MQGPINIRTEILDDLRNGTLRSTLERYILPAWLPRQRWFRAKSRAIATVSIESAVSLEGGTVFSILRVDFADNLTDDPHEDFERYALPLALVSGDVAADIPETSRIGPVPTAQGNRLLIDGCWDAGFRTQLLRILSGVASDKHENARKDENREAPSGSGILRGLPAHGEDPGPWVYSDHLSSRVLAAEQSNTSFVYASRIPGAPGIFVKLYRRLEGGIHPEPEMLRFLREHTDYRGVPAFLSALEWTSGGTDDAGSATVALAQEFVPGAANAWEYALEALRPLLQDPAAPVPEALTAWAALLGRRVGALHVALASPRDVPGFAPESLSPPDLERIRSGVRAQWDKAIPALASLSTRTRERTSEETALLARTVLKHRARLDALLGAGDLPDGKENGQGEERAVKTRTHGDLHLGQILVTREDIRILDFEGEPGRSLAEARAKQSPLRDVAGMLRSFHYAAHVAARDAGAPSGNEGEDSRAEVLSGVLGAAFLAGYFGARDGSAGPRESPRARNTLLDLFTLEKTVYEFRYECDNRPDWVDIPLHGLLRILTLSEADARPDSGKNSV
jgi:maltose alpha-D-glucosyltransferase/alpha-amylase